METLESEIKVLNDQKYHLIQLESDEQILNKKLKDDLHILKNQVYYIYIICILFNIYNLLCDFKYDIKYSIRLILIYNYIYI